MTFKVLNNYYAGGYTLSPAFTGLTIDGGAGAGGPGVTANFSTEIDNYGTVSGVRMTAGGTVKNHNLVSGNSGHGVTITGGAGLVENYGSIGGAGVVVSGTVNNFGKISAVTLSSGGLVKNEVSALIGSVHVLGSGGMVDNYGTLLAPSGFGVSFSTGGTVKNGILGLIYGAVGVDFTAAGAVKNYGTIIAYPQGHGVDLFKGGSIANGTASDTRALIEGGQIGIYVGGSAATVANFGTIQAAQNTYTAQGVLLTFGGVVNNGGASDWTALISGYTALVIQGGAGTVTNFGTITGTGNPPGTGGTTGTYFNAGGVNLQDGGSVINGSVTDRAALITGAYSGLDVSGLVTVSNFGTIEGAGVTSGQGSVGVSADGGKLTNGALADEAALVLGYDTGVSFEHAVGTVINFGTIESTRTAKSAAVVLVDGGAVTNGAGGDTTALLSGCYGVYFALAASVTNFGTIEGTIKYGISAHAGGTLTNGTVTDTKALVEGSTGVVMSLGAGTINNFGTVHGFGATAVSAGANLTAGGRVVNGSLSSRTAVIDGYTGLLTAGAATTVINFGTLDGVGVAGQAGATLSAAGALTNGAATDTIALIEGYVGLVTPGVVTVTNFGTIEGFGGVAVQFKSASDVLVVEAGSTFQGTVLGDGGTLTLTGVNGTLSGLSPGAGQTFENFATVNVAAGASFTLTGPATIATGVKLIDAGALSVAAGASLASSGAISGAGALILAGGAATLSSGGSLSVASVVVSSAASTVSMAATLTYAGAWTQSAGTLTVASGATANFSGAGDSFSGTVTGAGTVNFTAGSDTLSGVTLSAASMALKSAMVTLSGTITIANTVSATCPDVVVAAAGATLAGGGTLSLANGSTDIVQGASAAATLTNVNDRIIGAGRLGNGVMILVNDVVGILNANATIALTIDTGANAVINAGVIESTASGGLSIASAISNTGSLTVNAGVLTVSGAVTGAGVVRIGGGTADLAAAFSENVTFTGTTGTLELGQSQGYTGQVSGFSKSGATSLDLLDIGFTNGVTKASFSGKSTSGVLTVTDGTHTANITLIGNFTASTFTVSSDGHGGTTVVDPTTLTPAITPTPTPPVLPLVSAMAGFRAVSCGTAPPAGRMESANAMALVRPA